MGQSPPCVINSDYWLCNVIPYNMVEVVYDFISDMWAKCTTQFVLTEFYSRLFVYSYVHV